MRATRWSILVVVASLFAGCSSGTGTGTGTVAVVAPEPPPATEVAPAPLPEPTPDAAAAAPAAALPQSEIVPATDAALPTGDDPVLEGARRGPATAGPAGAARPGGAGTVQVANHRGGKPASTGRIEIPAIGLNHATYEGIDLPTIDHGPSHWPGTPLPGQRGNTVFPGHRTTHSRPFWDLDKLQPGNEVIFTTPAGRFTYKVTRTMIVPANAMYVTDQTPDATFTIMACHPKGSARQRIVVKGSLVSAPAPPPPPPPGAAPQSPPRQKFLGIL